MLIYLDVCTIQRPLDSKSHLRIVVEAEAVLGILALVEAGHLTLMASAAHAYEIERNPHPVRRRYAQEVVARAGTYMPADEPVRQLLEKFARAGIGPLDALHLACAVHGGAVYFCTCDDRLHRRGQSVDTGTTVVVTPLELIGAIET